MGWAKDFDKKHFSINRSGKSTSSSQGSFSRGFDDKYFNFKRNAPKERNYEEPYYEGDRQSTDSIEISIDQNRSNEGTYPSSSSSNFKTIAIYVILAFILAVFLVYGPTIRDMTKIASSDMQVKCQGTCNSYCRSIYLPIRGYEPVGSQCNCTCGAGDPIKDCNTQCYNKCYDKSLSVSKSSVQGDQCNCQCGGKLPYVS